jgi:hypothetical protein
MTFLATGLKSRLDRDNRTVEQYKDLFSWSNNPDRAMRKSVRKQRNPAMFRPQGAIATHEIPADQPPADVLAAFNDTFGNDAKTGAVRLILHPFFRRWTMVQKWRLRDKHTNEVVGEYWRPCWMAMKPAEARKIPIDYLGDPEKEHLAGVAGEYREPNKLDFLWIVENVGLRRIRDRAPASCDTVEKANRWAATQVNENLSKQDDDLERSAKSDRESQIHDHVSYYARLYKNYWNRLRGAAQRTMSTATIDVKSDKDTVVEVMGHSVPVESKYAVAKRDGYSVRARKGTAAAAEMVAENAAVEERANRILEDHERRRRLRASMSKQRVL